MRKIRVAILKHRDIYSSSGLRKNVYISLIAISSFSLSYYEPLITISYFPFHIGLYTGLSPVYNAEVAPDNIRGAMGTINQLAVTVGMLISQVLGLDEILGTDTLWPVLLGTFYQRFFHSLALSISSLHKQCAKRAKWQLAPSCLPPMIGK